jgi:hypothetical protein
MIGSHMLLILLTTLIASQGWEIIDQTDEEWASPEVQFDETVINPWDYVQSIHDDIHSVACHAFFTQTDGGFKWRLIIVGKDKLVVLQDWIVFLELNLPFDACGAVFSRNGQYSIVEGWTYEEDSPPEAKALLVRIDNGETTIFDPEPDDTACGLLLADDGTVVGVGRDFFIDYSPDLISTEIHDYEDLYIRHIGFSADSRVIILENVVDRPREILAFDWGGRLLWTTDIGDRTLANPVEVSMDGSLVGASFIHQGFMLLDGMTGEVLTEQFAGCQSSMAAISPDGSLIAIPTAFHPELHPVEQPDNLFLASVEELCASGSGEEILPPEGWGYTVGGISNTGEILICAFQSASPWDKKLALVDRNGELIWCSRVWSREEHKFTISPSFYNIDARLRSILYNISPDGSLVVYMDRETGHIHILSCKEAST